MRHIGIFIIVGAILLHSTADASGQLARLLSSRLGRILLAEGHLSYFTQTIPRTTIQEPLVASTAEFGTWARALEVEQPYLAALLQNRLREATQLFPEVGAPQYRVTGESRAALNFFARGRLSASAIESHLFSRSAALGRFDSFFSLNGREFASNAGALGFTQDAVAFRDGLRESRDFQLMMTAREGALRDYAAGTTTDSFLVSWSEGIRPGMNQQWAEMYSAKTRGKAVVRDDGKVLIEPSDEPSFGVLARMAQSQDHRLTLDFGGGVDFFSLPTAVTRRYPQEIEVTIESALAGFAGPAEARALSRVWLEQIAKNRFGFWRSVHQGFETHLPAGLRYEGSHADYHTCFVTPHFERTALQAMEVRELGQRVRSFIMDLRNPRSSEQVLTARWAALDSSIEDLAGRVGASADAIFRDMEIATNRFKSIGEGSYRVTSGPNQVHVWIVLPNDQVYPFFSLRRVFGRKTEGVLFGLETGNPSVARLEGRPFKDTILADFFTTDPVVLSHSDTLMQVRGSNAEVRARSGRARVINSVMERLNSRFYSVGNWSARVVQEQSKVSARWMSLATSPQEISWLPPVRFQYAVALADMDRELAELAKILSKGVHEFSTPAEFAGTALMGAAR